MYMLTNITGNTRTNFQLGSQLRDNLEFLHFINAFVQTNRPVSGMAEWIKITSQRYNKNK